MILVRDKIEEIVMAIQSSGSVDSYVDNTGSYTITTNGTDTMGGLGVGTKVVLIYSDTTNNRDAVIDSLTGTTFTFSGTGISQPVSWKMAIYFDVGHRVELNKKYSHKGKVSNSMVQKYPLFWLYTDFEMEEGNGEYIAFETTLQAALVDFSNATSYEEDRVADVFIPVLYPYLEMIETAFNVAPYKRNFVTVFGEDSRIRFKTVDRPFFGSADKNESVLPQYTDAIEIEMNLKWMIDSCSCAI